MTGFVPIAWTVTRRELAGYFATPVAYVFITVFLALSSALTFHLGDFFERGQADLRPFFQFHPWLYLFLIPALSMRLWAEERKTGTIELLLTLPVPISAAVIGKFLAAWLFAGVALAFTAPIWITVNYLGAPDNGVILASYLGSFLMAGAFLAIGSCMSALTKNQAVAFVLAAAVCFLFTVSGSPVVLSLFSQWAPQAVLETVSSFSFLTHYQSIQRGVIDGRDIAFHAATIVAFLHANVILVDLRKAS